MVWRQICRLGLSEGVTVLYVSVQYHGGGVLEGFLQGTNERNTSESLDFAESFF